MLTFLLAQKISSLFVIILVGAVLVKTGLLRAEMSRTLSTLGLYVFGPAAILSSFQVDMTDAVVAGMLLALAVAVASQLALIVIVHLLGRLVGFDAIEIVSVIYSNCGNLLIPLVSGVLGPEWVIFTMPYMCSQTVLMWTHCRSTVQGLRKVNVKAILTNVNMISIAIGLVMFVTGLRFPTPVSMAVDSLAAFIGPSAMLVAGMLLGSMHVKEVLANKRVWLVAALRLLAVPLLAILVFKLTGIASLVPDGQSVLLISLLALAAPSASMVVNMAQVYDRNPRYASAINVVTLLLCVATMPAMAFLWEL